MRAWKRSRACSAATPTAPRAARMRASNWQLGRVVRIVPSARVAPAVRAKRALRRSPLPPPEPAVPAHGHHVAREVGRAPVAPRQRLLMLVRHIEGGYRAPGARRLHGGVRAAKREALFGPVSARGPVVGVFLDLTG